MKSTLFSLCHINLSATVPQTLKGHSKEKIVPGGTQSRSHNLLSYNSKHSFVKRPKFKRLLMVQSIHLKQMQIASQKALRYTGPLKSKVRGPMVLAYTPNTEEQMQQWIVQLTEAVPGQHWQTCPSHIGNPPSHNSGWPTSE